VALALTERRHTLSTLHTSQHGVSMQLLVSATVLGYRASLIQTLFVGLDSETTSRSGKIDWADDAAIGEQ
jgi:hypothetical protein